MTSTADREPEPVPAVPAAVCPYLRATSGEWRSVVPSRDHLCSAQSPAMPLGLETQRRFCLAEPAACERFRAATEAREAFAPVLPIRPIARTAPVVLERGRAPLAIPVSIDRRAAGQAALAIVMIAAAAALIFARGSQPNGATGQVASPSPTPTSTATAEPSAAGSPTPSPATSPSASPTTRPSPTPRPSAVARHTYRVRPGDTLGAIALRFGTTVKAISALNGIKDPSLIRPGQVLKIP
jgi:LysM repeat protein